jgi:hypothetical protein
LSNLAIQIDVALQQARHELIVRQAVLARCSVDALNPQGAKIALLGLAISVIKNKK